MLGAHLAAVVVIVAVAEQSAFAVITSC